MLGSGKICIAAGIILILLGIIILLAERIPGAGRLPGDIVIRKGNLTFYFPLMTSILLSAVISFLLFLFNKR
ncbi:MAG TPA: DUF2905 domain-containing protein [Candidatus Omnitrophota bacterium]|nr:DUF2905 domain-containing protein [Candidatus Omnitrophota bacterium]HQL41172.1 DUF2905 domain-containing protein [Candidatus Omnitrophota bacterium]